MRTFGLWVFVLGGALSVQAQKFILPPVMVTASRIHSTMVSDLRESTVLSRREIATLPIQSVSELMGYLGQVEFNQRGPGGVQADLGMRGSSFEQVVILVNGIRMNDPQTGHHNSDLPVTLDEIERIEILPGHGSSMYGPDAFGGVIHILTRAPKGHGLKLWLQGGSFKTFGMGITANWQRGQWKHRLGLERQTSDGYRYDTEYAMNTASVESHGQLASKPVNTRIAVTAKDFGANGFYASMPSWEATRAYTAQGGIAWIQNGNHRLQSRASLRHHRDHFILTVEDPKLYENRQNTWSAAFETEWTGRISGTQQGAAGIELYADALESPGLGDHERRRFGLFVESAKTWANSWVLHGGLRMDAFEGRQAQYSPTMSLKIPLRENLLLRSSVGRAYRAPSYTELYYQSPANQGDLHLKPESSWSYETGIVVTQPAWRLALTGFIRNENDRIDWIRSGAHTSPWQAVNLGRLTLGGLSMQMHWQVARQLKMQWSYTGLHRTVESEEAVISKYSWAIPRHRAQLILDYSPFQNLQLASVTRYLKRDDGSSLFLADLRLIWRVLGMENSLNLKNILDTDYEEIRNVPLPGRHFLLGVSRTL